jgi:two-component system chemotaxis sensor kinase CheA
MRGEETDLDKNLVEALADPLIHLVRNSVDHGVEMPDERVKVGKSRTGKVILAASQEGDHIELSIADDGGGMDADKLRGIAVKRGLMDADAASRLSDKECFNLIFAPGFSTKEKITDVSGRGVGMDVVKTAINTLNGSIDIDSEMGKGTKITIKVPLTLAILPTLMVGVSKQPFALPLGSVNEIFHLDLGKTNTVDGQLTIIVREKSIPLFYLQDWLCPNISRDPQKSGHGHVVIVQIGSQRVGFVVDTLIGQEEVVIKPLDELLQGTPGMAGATITSDGHIALILDVPNLLKRYATRGGI